MSPEKNQLQPGQCISLFLDPHTNERHLGKGILVEKTREASINDAFILEEMPVNKQINYSFEYWKINVLEVTDLGRTYNLEPSIETTRPIKVIYKVGVVHSNTRNHINETSNPRLQDRFISVEGIGEVF